MRWGSSGMGNALLLEVSHPISIYDKLPSFDITTVHCSVLFLGNKLSKISQLLHISKVVWCPLWVTVLAHKGFCRFPVSRHFSYSVIQGILSFILFLYTFHIQKCLETGKLQNPLKKSLFQLYSNDDPI